MSRLKISEVFCYICRGILLEPVTLPCYHVFCLSCFEQSMQETSYSCPLCRKRISNWVRSVKKSNKLVNQKLWNQIKQEFNKEVRLKLNGEDDGLDQQLQKDYEAFVKTSKPGEVAQEFSKFLNNFRTELDKLKEAEELASKEYILKLQEEEERQLRILNETNTARLKEDEILAKRIQEEINKELNSPSTNNTNKKTSKRNKKSQKVIERPSKGPMDDFLQDSKNIKENSFVENTKEERSTSADSTDSIRLEMNLFKPIKRAHTTPPKQYPDGRIKEISLTKVTPLKLSFSFEPPSSSSTGIIEGRKIHSSHSAFVDTNGSSHDIQDDYESPSKKFRFTSDEIENNVLKDITLGDNADSAAAAQGDSIKKGSIGKSSRKNLGKNAKFCVDQVNERKEEIENEQFETQDYLDYSTSIEDEIIAEQRKMEALILQEKMDRELALKLSREWESEMGRKPQTRSMKAAAAAAAVKNAQNVRSQPTIMESISRGKRNRK